MYTPLLCTPFQCHALSKRIIADASESPIWSQTNTGPIIYRYIPEALLETLTELEARFDEESLKSDGWKLDGPSRPVIVKPLPVGSNPHAQTIKTAKKEYERRLDVIAGHCAHMQVSEASPLRGLGLPSGRADTKTTALQTGVRFGRLIHLKVECASEQAFKPLNYAQAMHVLLGGKHNHICS